MNLRLSNIYALSKAVFILLLLGPALCLAAGGNVNGVIKGQVVGDDGIGVANVLITVTDASVGLERSVETGTDGQFRMQLPTGTYKLVTQASGRQSITVEAVNVTVGSSSNLRLVAAQSSMEEVVVYGSADSLVNTAVAETSLNMSLEEFALLPVPRNIESVALLAPGTVFGDSAFGEEKTLVSFNGASVAENAYFINGMNVTNFRNGLGGSTVPFEFYDQFQVKTGGYSAEFGRSTGGVLNAVTKTGSNEFHSGIVGYFEPAGVAGDTPDTILNNGILYDSNAANTRSGWTTDIYASGPIIKDRLFFYALYELQDRAEEYNSLGATETFNHREIDNDFWGANLLWNITDNHALAVTAFTDTRERVLTQYDYDLESKTRGAKTGAATESRGGDNIIVRYDGHITDNFAVSALYGNNKYDLTDSSDVSVECPLVVSLLDGGLGGNFSTRPGCEASTRIELGADEREAYRLDFEWYWGNHTLRAGLDNEVNTSVADQTYPGTGIRNQGGLGIYYRYITSEVGAELPNGGIVPDANGDGSRVDIVRWRISDVSGNFETTASAWYIEDRWDINDQFSASFGIRNETFDNGNGLGQTFIEIKNQIAPRLGLVWRPGGSYDSRVFANWGRYHLPVANNTNVRLSGAEDGRQRYFVFDGNFDLTSASPTTVDANGIPTTTEIGPELVTANGVTPDSAQLADQNIEPMFQDEFILGYEKTIADDWLLGVRYINRDLASGIDDVLINDAVDALGYEHTGDAGGYVLANPGSDITIPYDRYGTGQLETTTFTADLLGYPKAERTYQALEFTIEKAFTDRWGLRGSYTWSKSEGNTEGYVKSDNGQDDAGITTDFDQTQLMDGSYGLLPNNRTHQFKLFGNFEVSERFVLGADMLLQSGRPVNIFGTNHPDGPPSYGNTYYITDPATGVLRKIPRGTAGETPWVTRLNLSAIYTFEWNNTAEVELRAEVFNLMDAHSVLEVYELGEVAPGSPDPQLGAPTSYQAPRTFRLGASIRF